MARLTTEERQKNIIEEAMNIIHESGYQSLSIREIANRVKISEPAIYRHFLNKEDIVLGILSKISDFDLELKNEIELKNSNEEKLEEFILFHFKFLEKNKTMTSVIFAEEMFMQSKILKEKFMKLISFRKKLLVDLIQEAKQNEKTKDVNTENLTTIVLGFIRLTVLEWKLNDFSFSLVEKGKSVTNSLKKLVLE